MSAMFKIFCDLDGVIVDFNRFAEEHIGHSPYEWDLDKSKKKAFWKAVARWTREGNKFFELMHPMGDMDQLWDYISPHSPTILSATGHVCGAADEKRNWVRLHLGESVADTAIFVQSAGNKAEYAGVGHILIDDRPKAIDPWVEAGGIGILHTSAERTIVQLTELGL